jgi:hypothetical protein
MARHQVEFDMRRVKNQHYVSQCCLRRHTQDGKTIFVFDKPKRKAFPRNIDEVASESGFYDLSPEFVKDFQVVEKWLCKVESQATSAIDHLIACLEKAHGFNPKDHPLRVMIALFLAIQHARTALARQTQTERRELIVEELKARSIEVPAELLNVPDHRAKFEHCSPSVFLRQKDCRSSVDVEGSNDPQPHSACRPVFAHYPVPSRKDIALVNLARIVGRLPPAPAFISGQSNLLEMTVRSPITARVAGKE